MVFQPPFLQFAAVVGQESVTTMLSITGPRRAPSPRWGSTGGSTEEKFDHPARNRSSSRRSRSATTPRRARRCTTRSSARAPRSSRPRPWADAVSAWRSIRATSRSRSSAGRTSRGSRRCATDGRPHVHGGGWVADRLRPCFRQSLRDRCGEPVWVLQPHGVAGTRRASQLHSHVADGVLGPRVPHRSTRRRQYARDRQRRQEERINGGLPATVEGDGLAGVDRAGAR